jgi:hypothetical protein
MFGRRVRVACACAWVLSFSGPGCGGGGQYGYAKVYAPNDAEEAAEASAVEYDPIMANRRPHEWTGKTVSLFGVVEKRGGKGADADVKVSLRQLQPRNLCETADTDTCRVTVSDQTFGMLHVQLRLEGGDAVGNTVGGGSLVRVIGKLDAKADPSDGLPVVKATFYRHWPRANYVTTKARAYMLR